MGKIFLCNNFSGGICSCVFFLCNIFAHEDGDDYGEASGIAVWFSLVVDQLASCNLTDKYYGTMTRLLRERFNNHKGSKDKKKVGLRLGLEGVYQLRDVPGGNLSGVVFETVEILS
jgi:hypothetical protein